MKPCLIGFLACYALMITAFATMLATGSIASIRQACVQYDYVTGIEGKK